MGQHSDCGTHQVRPCCAYSLPYLLHTPLSSLPAELSTSLSVILQCAMPVQAPPLHVFYMFDMSQQHTVSACPLHVTTTYRHLLVLAQNSFSLPAYLDMTGPRHPQPQKLFAKYTSAYLMVTAWFYLLALCVQNARYLLKNLLGSQSGRRPQGSAAYLGNAKAEMKSRCEVSKAKQWREPGQQLAALR